VNTGNPTPAVKAINTRFDMYDGTGNPLGQCTGNVCQPAANVTKDFIKTSAGGCGVNTNHNNNANAENWHTPTNKFIPKAYSASDGPMTQYDADHLIDAMGLPRDNCHYGTYNHACSGGRLGDGSWARYDYFNKYHSTENPSADDASLSESTMTRYETYKWEIQYNHIPSGIASGSDRQEGIPVCRPNPPSISPRDRRVLQVAIGSNCASLHGASANVTIGDWVDFFFVEPGAPNNARGNSLDTGDEIYLEVIGRSTSGANGQIERRDVPYLVR
jgi:hypothetical protein